MIGRLALRAAIAIALGVSLWLVADRMIEQGGTKPPAQMPTSGE